MPYYDVTHLADEDCGLLSGSVAELGSNAGAITWRNSVEMGKSHPLVTSEDADEVRDYFRAYGAWTKKEIDQWTLEDLNGLVTQEAASGFREFEAFDSYEEYQAAAEQGSVSANLWRGEDGRWTLALCH